MEFNTSNDPDFSFQVLSNQIGGHHVFTAHKPSILKHEGYIMKPLPNDKRGRNETFFYETIALLKNEDALIKGVSKFVPIYKGISTMKFHNKEVKYMKLEDLGDKFVYPCNIDIKIGSIIYGEEASEEKKRTQLTKYPEGIIIGFRIVGMNVYDENLSKYNSFDRQFGLSLTAENIVNGIHQYLNSENTCISLLITCSFLHRLKDIENWFRTQRKFAFYGSSLLFYYEGSIMPWLSIFQEWIHSNVFYECGVKEKINSSNPPLKHVLTFNSETPHTIRNNLCKTLIPYFIFTEDGSKCSTCYLNSNICANMQSTSSLTDVRMIDFAHICHSKFKDINYIYGLSKLIETFQKLQEKMFQKCLKNYIE